MGDLKKCVDCKTYQVASLFPGKAVQSICQSCRSERRRQDRASMREAVLRMLGSECVCCGESEPVFLDLDHVNGDGAGDRRRATWRSALQDPDRFQILCRNCNWAKYMGGCPHG